MPPIMPIIPIPIIPVAAPFALFAASLRAAIWEVAMKALIPPPYKSASSFLAFSFWRLSVIAACFSLISFSISSSASIDAMLMLTISRPRPSSHLPESVSFKNWESSDVCAAIAE